MGAVVEAVGPGLLARAAGGRPRGDPPDQLLRPAATRAGSGAANVCDNFSLIGIHADGGLQEQLRMPEALAFPPASTRPAIAALAEPLSIGVRGDRPRADRGRRARGDASGPGRSARRSRLLARDRGAEVLIDRHDAEPAGDRRGLGRRDDALERRRWSRWRASGPAARAPRWCSTRPARRTRSGPGSRCRGLGGAAGDRRDVPPRRAAARVRVHRQGARRARRELRARTATSSEAVGFVEAQQRPAREPDQQEFPLERAPEALQWAMDHPSEAMKVVIGDIN